MSRQHECHHYLHNLLNNWCTSSSMSLRSSRQPLLEIRRCIELSMVVGLSVLLPPKTGTNFRLIFSYPIPVQFFENAWKHSYLKLLLITTIPSRPLLPNCFAYRHSFNDSAHTADNKTPAIWGTPLHVTWLQQANRCYAMVSTEWCWEENIPFHPRKICYGDVIAIESSVSRWAK